MTPRPGQGGVTPCSNRGPTLVGWLSSSVPPSRRAQEFLREELKPPLPRRAPSRHCFTQSVPT